MPTRRTKLQIRQGVTLGGEVAEFDPFRSEAFQETWLYQSVQSHEHGKCFLVGRTGAGKSACLLRLEEMNPEHVIRINPEDLSLPYITELGVIKELSALEVHLDPLFIALWKHVLVVEIIKHRYKVDSPEAKQRFLAGLIERVKRDGSKRAALEYLSDFGDKFWYETDERVKEITTTFENKINQTSGGKFGVGPASLSLGGDSSDSESVQERVELVNRYQRIVNETQLSRLNKMMDVLDEDILDSDQHFTYIVIDDLDRDWADEKIANDLIRCLFRAVADFRRVRNLKIIVALRTNIFDAIDFGRSGGQGEKFRALIHRIEWTRLELQELLNNRVLAATSEIPLNSHRWRNSYRTKIIQWEIR